MSETTIIACLIIIVLSNILHITFPKLPLALTQIAMGVLLAFLPTIHSFIFSSAMLQETHAFFTLHMEPEIFMAFIISPLLFREAEESDFFGFWKLKKTVLFMAFILVFITVVSVGYIMNMMVAFIPLAACFALGAILGPTDVVAVSSLSAGIKIKDEIGNILKGEGLINDASGVIAFQFAVLALTTGKFSLTQTVSQFFIVAIGGLLVGLVIAMCKRTLVNALKSIHVRSTATFMFIEILVPFLCYIIGEMFHVSGIIAAVTAGTMQGFTQKKLDMFEVDFSNVKRTVWDIVTFTMNSLVFILLGLQLPGVIMQIADNEILSRSMAIILPLVIVLIIFTVRFCSVFFVAKPHIGEGKERLKDALYLTLSGVKGAVSLAVAFSLPYTMLPDRVFAQRPLLLYLTGAVIIISLIPATFVLPLLGNKKGDEDSYTKARAKVLRWMIVYIGLLPDSADLKDGIVEGKPKFYKHLEDENDINFTHKRAFREMLKDTQELEKTIVKYKDATLLNYKKRLSDLYYIGSNRAERNKLKKLRAYVTDAEERLVKEKAAKGEIDEETEKLYLNVIIFMRRSMKHKFFSGIMLRMLMVRIGLLRLVKGRKKGNEYLNSVRGKSVAVRERNIERLDDFKNMISLFWEDTKVLIDNLSADEIDDDGHLISKIITDRQLVAANVIDALHGEDRSIALMEGYEHSIIAAFEIERMAIAILAHNNELSDDDKDMMVIALNKMENYMLEEHNRGVADSLVKYIERDKE